MASRSLTADSKLLADHTAKNVRKLVRAETRGPGDQEAALHRLGAKYGLSYWTLWSWLYRPPKEAGVAFYLRLSAALEDQAEKQRRAYETEQGAAREYLERHPILARAAAYLAREDDGEMK